jgi:hypothetical protein
MTFHDIDAAKTLFHGLEVETFEERRKTAMPSMARSTGTSST